MYTQQEQHLPLITPDLFRQYPDQVCDIMNRLIRFYEQYRDYSLKAIQQNTTNLVVADDVVNGIQTDITNIHTDLNNLATVARTGDYNDLINKPPQAEVYNGKLTIQKNGTQVAEFTANQSTDATADITVPVITMQTTDPGEGASLAANNFIAVYQ